MDAELAIEVYVHRLRREIAAMTAALGGLDLLVFTGGGGEHATWLRARAVEGLGFLGVDIDAHANAVTHADAEITAGGDPEGPPLAPLLASQLRQRAGREHRGGLPGTAPWRTDCGGHRSRGLEIARQVRLTTVVLTRYLLGS